MPAAAAPIDRGETMIELLVALAIMSVAVVVLAGGLGTAVTISDIHRKQATAGLVVRNYAEFVTSAVAAGGYPASCVPLAIGYAAPTGYTASIVSQSYWTGSGWSAACSTDTGLRQLTLQVAGPDGRASEQLTVEVRKPCGLADPPCA
jgi:prepilin-type N-terminal cleavage/methylation domain-containing protein